jgi:pimeloyl-ACP methyl ester carboxylesterase
MGAVQANGITIEYESFGSPSDPTVLLVCGFTSQLLAWDERFCRALADGGRRVIRYDNRDTGLSTHLDGVRVSIDGIFRARKGDGSMPEVPYTLSDFAADGMGLLDALGIDSAHIMGMSMGGMIVQTMAIEHPTRVRSLVSVMSTTGENEFGRSTKEANAALMSAPPTERQAFIDGWVRDGRLWSSPRFYDEDRAAALAAASYDRAFYPEGANRQLAAILSSPARADGLRALDVPTLVIHGLADTLITPSGGQRTAELVPNSNLLLLGDMGHDIPVALWPVLVPAVLGHTAFAESLRPAAH